MKNKDGIERDISKLSTHWGIIQIECLPHWEKFKRARIKNKSHEYVNLFVEAGRSPRLLPQDANYFMGHAFAIYFAVSVPCVLFSLFSFGYFIGLVLPL